MVDEHSASLGRGATTTSTEATSRATRPRSSQKDSQPQSRRTPLKRTTPHAEVQVTATARSKKLRWLKRWAFIGACGAAAGFVGVLALSGAYAVRGQKLVCGTHICPSAEPYVALVPAAIAIRSVIFLRRRPWQQRRSRGYFEEVSEAVMDGATGSLLIVFFAFFFRAGFEFRAFSYSRLVFLYDWLLATVLLVLLSAAVKTMLCHLRTRGHDQRNVVIVGSGRGATTFEQVIRDHPELGYNIVGQVGIPREGEGSELQTKLLDIARETRVDESVLATPGIQRRHLAQLVGAAELVHLEIKAVPELFGLPPTKVTSASMGHLPVLSLLGEPLPGGRRALKRAVDLLLSFLLLAGTAPALLIIAATVKISSPGPILLRQERVGMDGRPFQMLKFRTMRVNADSRVHENYVSDLIQTASAKGSPGGEQVLYKLTNDPRVTPVGHVLRRLSLDELPQLINVLRGEMSVVGPRPALPFEVALYQDGDRRRLEVRPGITGLWQVNGRSKLTFRDMVRLDIQYIDTWSPLLDAMIILKTLPAVLRRETG